MAQTNESICSVRCAKLLSMMNLLDSYIFFTLSLVHIKMTIMNQRIDFCHEEIYFFHLAEITFGPCWIIFLQFYIPTSVSCCATSREVNENYPNLTVEEIKME